MFQRHGTVFFRGMPFKFYGASSKVGRVLIYEERQGMPLFQDVFLTKHDDKIWYNVDSQSLSLNVLNNKIASRLLDKEW